MTYHSACRDAVWRGVWNKKEMKLEPTTVWLKQKDPLSDELAINILSINLPPGPCAPFSTLSASLSEGLCTALMFWEPQKQLGNILFLFPAGLKVSTKKTSSGFTLCLQQWYFALQRSQLADDSFVFHSLTLCQCCAQFSLANSSVLVHFSDKVMTSRLESSVSSCSASSTVSLV